MEVIVSKKNPWNSILNIALRLAALLISVLLFYLGTLSLEYGVFGSGSLMIVVAGGCMALTAILWKLLGKLIKMLWAKKMGRILLRTGITGFCILLLCMTISGICVLTPIDSPVYPDSTVIVLGARVVGTSPTISLYQRLKATEEYLNDHSQAICIVSGGQGEDEIMPEAEVMKNWLVEKGIDPERIITEPLSVNTRSNLANSAEIIEEYGLSKNVVIVTDNLHEFRAAYLARKAGLNPYAYPSYSPFALQPAFFVREVLAVIKDILLLR